MVFPRECSPKPSRHSRRLVTNTPKVRRDVLAFFFPKDIVWPWYASYLSPALHLNTDYLAVDTNSHFEGSNKGNPHNFHSEAQVSRRRSGTTHYNSQMLCHDSKAQASTLGFPIPSQQFSGHNLLSFRTVRRASRAFSAGADLSGVDGTGAYSVGTMRHRLLPHMSEELFHYTRWTFSFWTLHQSLLASFRYKLHANKR